MWHILVNLYVLLHPLSVKSAWVEIPQLPSSKPTHQIQNKPTQFVFGAPKVSFVDQKTTTPSNHKHRIETTTAKIPPTTLANYKNVMTSTAIPPLTTTPKIPEMEDRNDTETTANEETENSENAKNEEASGFLPLLQSIQHTLTLNAKKSLKSKISLLADLRDNLLANIDERMSNLWKRSDDVSARGHDDHEMDFPSNEGALMTIGFLTFAVFLIKLVLKLIHALKYKHNGNMVMMTTTAPAAAFIGRKKRDLEDDGLNILQLIDEYKFG